jgi:ketosteroid isomerase-like protein
MTPVDPVDVVLAWIAAANAGDVERLLVLSSPDIEVVGPRGSGTGQQLLREWLARAGLTLETKRVFAAGDAVVLEQSGVWRAQDTGEVTGERALASAFRVGKWRVAWFARFDDLDAALAAAGLQRSDER